MQHYFDVRVAVEYGVTEAILLNNIFFWVEKNKANEQGFHDGRYWTYNTVKAFVALFPYLTGKQVRNALNKLKREGLVVTGNYSENQYDRTLWYSLTDKAYMLLDPKSPICPTGQMELPEKANQFAQKGKSICPTGQIYYYTNSKPDNKPNIEEAPKGKINYAEFVWLTELEYEALQKRLGSKEAVNECITILDNYKGSNGKEYVSDYRAILSWVIDRYKERHTDDKKKASNNVAGTTLEVLARMRAKKEGGQHGELQQ